MHLPVLLRPRAIGAPCSHPARTWQAQQLPSCPSMPIAARGVHVPHRPLPALCSDVARLRGADGDAFSRLYAVSSGLARCSVSPELSKKYAMEEDNRCSRGAWMGRMDDAEHGGRGEPRAGRAWHGMAHSLGPGNLAPCQSQHAACAVPPACDDARTWHRGPRVRPLPPAHPLAPCTWPYVGPRQKAWRGPQCCAVA